MSLRQNFFNLLAKKKQDDIPNYLCFQNLANPNEEINITFTTVGSSWGSTSYPYPVLEYSNDGKTWNNLAINTAVSGKKIYVRGDNNRFGYSSSRYIKITTTSTRIDATGNIMSLIDKTMQSTALPSSKSYIFAFLFESNKALYTAPELPATTLATHCYRGLFFLCDNLKNAPELPAMTLSTYCYYSMFQGCTKLENAPELPATTLSAYCYTNMFSGCTSLINAPELPATTLGVYCYNSMFLGCTKLENAPELPATTLSAYCYTNMFSGCASLINAPELPATTLAQACYNSMFYGCTSLINAPELPATTLSDNCYLYMFNGCKGLKEIRLAYKGSFSTTYFMYWVSGIAQSGTFYYDGTDRTHSVSSIPPGWTVLPYTQPTGHTVQVSISNSEKSYATGLYIYDGNDTTGTLLKSYTTVPDEVDEQFTVSSGNIFIYPTSSRDVWIEDYSASGGVSEMDVGETGWFEVNGDGSIFCNINYHY